MYFYCLSLNTTAREIRTLARFLVNNLIIASVHVPLRSLSYFMYQYNKFIFHIQYKRVYVDINTRYLWHWLYRIELSSHSGNLDLVLLQTAGYNGDYNVRAVRKDGIQIKWVFPFLEIFTANGKIFVGSSSGRIGLLRHKANLKILADDAQNHGSYSNLLYVQHFWVRFACIGLEVEY